MEDAVAAAVFVAAVGTLMVVAVYTIAPFLSAKVLEAPVAPSEGLPERRVYVYFDGGVYYAVEFDGEVEWFRSTVGVNGSLAAVFFIYPGGYKCQLMPGYASVRLGGDPYTGLWCPLPFKNASVTSCVPVGVVSRGRWLLVQYKCP
ncbi:MAG: hypothetical protein ABWK05_08430 [Pyrobaculum sp.]